MIQHVQTLWMILAALAVFLTLQFPFYGGTLVTDNSYHAITATDNLLLLMLTSALGTGIAIDIFLYKNRKLQMRITIAAILLECLIIFLYIQQISKFSNGNFALTSALHILVLVFLFFAIGGIYRDSKLIRESNRLR